jgi:predicted ribosome quality control (RQC) complex YloA/Tae2 family protein
MDPKREVTSVDLVALTRELSGYTGAKVDKAYLYGDDLLRLKMRDFDRGRVELLIEVGETKRAHVARPEHVADAPGRPPNFAKMLRNRIAGADFVGVRQHGFDRILVLEFRREDADTTIVAELFGEGNVAVLDEAGDVVDSLQTIRLQSRTVAPGAQYGFPQARVNPLDLDFDGFVAHMEESDTDVVRTLATQLNFGGLYGEELCTRANVDKELDIGDATEDEFRSLYDAVQRTLDPVSTGETDPRVYYEDDRRVDVTPIPLDEYAHLESEAFDSVNEALDDYFTNREIDASETPATEESGPDFESEIEQRERIITQQEAAIEEFEADADAERERAELVYAHYELVDEILTTIQEAREAGHGWDDIEETLAEGAEAGIEAAEAVVDIDPAEGMVTVDLEGHDVPLDPRHGVEKNADRIYKAAKRIEEKREGALAAVENTREELAEIERRKAEWEARDETDEEAETVDEDIDWLSRSSIPVRKPETWYDRFRWFRTSDGFLVIGGRNAEQNEEIVQKYMEPTDRFFHAQAHGGPVTVLKTSDPSEPSKDIDVPERSLEEAAQFAVTYSSVWKEGKFSGDAYMVDPEQVSKTPESGEFLEKGGFAIRGDRTYFEDTPVGCAVGIICEPETRVIGGPPSVIEERAETSIRLEPGQYAQGDAAKRMYREFRERFEDTSFVRKVASPDEIQLFMPPGGSRMVD